MKYARAKRLSAREIGVAGFVLSFSIGAQAAEPSAPGDDTSSSTCHVAQTFPDGSKWEGGCVFSIVRPGQNPYAPKGMLSVLDANGDDHLLSINFLPPADIKVGQAYDLSTDRQGTFLNGLVQPFPGKEICHMNQRFPSQGKIVFSAVGATNPQYHGSIELYPTCSIYQATPQQRMVPGSEVGGGKTTVTF